MAPPAADNVAWLVIGLLVGMVLGLATYHGTLVARRRSKKAKAMANQIATVSKLRLINKHGTIAKSDMPGVDHAIKIQLHLH